MDRGCIEVAPRKHPRHSAFLEEYSDLTVWLSKRILARQAVATAEGVSDSTMHLVVPPCARERVAVLESVLAVAVLAVVYPHACEVRAIWIGLDAGAIALASSQHTDIALGGFAHVSVLEMMIVRDQ